MSESHQERGGERRRRREEERLRSLAAEQATERPKDPAGPADAVTGVGAAVPAPHERPMSRRELRERAESAAQASAAPVAAPRRDEPAVASAPVAAARPAPVPAHPAGPEPALSRRQIRAAATGETQGAARAQPTVQPPPVTGGIRRISSEGVLSDVERVVPRPRSGSTGSVEGNASLMSPQARAAAVAAQAARAQAEREEQARLNESRAQAQRSSQRPVPDRPTVGDVAGDRGDQPEPDRRTAADDERPAEQAPGNGRTLQGRAVHERALRERAAQERAVQRRAEQSQARQEHAARERAAQEQAPQDQGVAQDARGQQAQREQAQREQAQREQAQREQVQREQAQREQVQREQVQRERAHSQDAGTHRPETRPAQQLQPVGEVRGHETPRVLPTALTPAYPGAGRATGLEPARQQTSWAGAGQPGRVPASREALGSVAVVPAGKVPRIGQTFGSVSLAPASIPAVTPAERTASVPRWGDVAPAPWTPTPASQDQPVGDDPTEPEIDGERPHPAHPYTWRHMVVLVLVAFVLAMLITMVVQNDASPSGAEGARSLTPVVAMAAGWTHLTTGE